MSCSGYVVSGCPDSSLSTATHQGREKSVYVAPSVGLAKMGVNWWDSATNSTHNLQQWLARLWISQSQYLLCIVEAIVEFGMLD